MIRGPELAVAALRRRTVRLLVALAWLAPLLACASGRGAPDEPAVPWAAGPVRWLILPEEAREMRRLAGSHDVVTFIEEFWRRRDPDPTEPGNPYLETFNDRVRAADRLYAEDGVRGALTDRGRALVLLGPPPVLRYRQEPVVQPGGATGVAARPRMVTIEEWEYPPDSLPRDLLRDLEPEAWLVGVTLRFAQGRRSTYLESGKRVLEAAARAAVERR